MRELHRPPVICASCGAKIYNSLPMLSSVQHDQNDDVEANWKEPPDPK
jgi:hypothetical protein